MELYKLPVQHTNKAGNTIKASVDLSTNEHTTVQKAILLMSRGYALSAQDQKDGVKIELLDPDGNSTAEAVHSLDDDWSDEIVALFASVNE